ncbi:MAG: putative Calcium/calmodulin-dependent protein kinase type 1 [Streblomastix strix]|uniref:Putative Calcium/calmodulin-dependent protein kinase type 1 n=1 Tax=Streblomastix strix TaxID=222440 RepID=A0A5J4WXJ5_9EUKA|nr:MAG: putative Calcium/calmodulin-dependent protein kinase type 1 [Streblomastix strix]
MSKEFPKIEGILTDFEENYEILDKIGEGTFAKVKKAKNKKTGELVAIKFIDKKKVTKDSSRIEALLKEIEIMNKQKHPYIIPLYGIYDYEDKLCLVMELVTGGELFDKIVDRGSYSERDASLLMLQMFRAVRYMHQKSIPYCDIKIENILYESDHPLSPVKLSDFGLSRLIEENLMMQTSRGTPGYVAPEVLENKGIGLECDLWSLGVIMFVLLCGYPPFYHENEVAMFHLIQEAKFEFDPQYWDQISASAKDLISHLLVVDTTKRFNVEQALSHPWFSEALPTYKLEAAFDKIKEKKIKNMFHSTSVTANVVTLVTWLKKQPSRL